VGIRFRGEHQRQPVLTGLQELPVTGGLHPFPTIVSGLDVIKDIAKHGSDNSNAQGDGHPKEKVTIESVTITKT
jgi:cyclophilin family peptidyl-prolyl cis-trans isomerase